ncbi:MAG: hypothetical protein Q8O92_10215 [Candidatus Latescibacter sp.]|nr:hypothetical protein [Candidatus Latescibacter sp.]
MIIVMKQGAGEEQIQEIVRLIEKLGFTPHLSRGEVRTIIGVIGGKDKSNIQQIFASLDSVESVIPILKPFKLASIEMHHEPTVMVSWLKCMTDRKRHFQTARSLSNFPILPDV